MLMHNSTLIVHILHNLHIDLYLYCVVHFINAILQLLLLQLLVQILKSYLYTYVVNCHVLLALPIRNVYGSLVY